MADRKIQRVHGRLVIASWTEGFKRCPIPKLRTEEDLIRHLLYLENHGRADEADLLLQRYCG